MSGHQDTIAAIDQELATLDDRRAKLIAARTALVALEADGASATVPAPPKLPAAERSGGPRSRPQSRGGPNDRDLALIDKTLTVLKGREPIPPGALYQTLGINKKVGRRLMRHLQAHPRMAVTGKTNARRIALA